MPAHAPRAFGEERVEYIEAARFAGPRPLEQPIARAALDAQRRAPLLGIGPGARPLLRRVDAGAGALPFHTRRRFNGEPHRPGIAEPAPVRPFAGILRLVAVEEAAFDRDVVPRRSHGGHCDRALQHLAEMVVHGIQHGRPAHRVVGAERGEPFTGRQRHSGRPAQIAQHVGQGEHQLVDVGMGMATVVEAFPVRAGRQRAVGHRPALDVGHAVEPHPVRQSGGLRHQHRLDEARLGGRRAARDGGGARENGDGLAGEADPGRGRRRLGPGGDRQCRVCFSSVLVNHAADVGQRLATAIAAVRHENTAPATPMRLIRAS